MILKIKNHRQKHDFKIKIMSNYRLSNYLSNPSQRKTQADAGILKMVTDRDRRNIKRQLTRP